MVRADGVEAVLAQLLVAARVERQFDRPVMGEVERSPFAVIKLHPRRAARLAGFDQAAAAGEFEVQSRIGGVAEGKSPAPIHQQALASAGSCSPACAKS